MPPKTIETFECSICCADDLPVLIRNKPNRIICPSCSNICCLECQKQYGKGDCMNCHLEFKQNFIIEHMGKQFIDKVLKPKIIEELMIEQRNGLKYIQPLVDWEKEVRKQKKNARFGIPITIPDRPKVSKIDTKNQVFPCPKTNCRGFVQNGICGLCGEKVCLICRELTIDEKHICNPETLQSLSILNTDTKPCPKCCALIHRTQGCNHMFCTHCRTHFDWVSGKILKNSTNGHYLNLQQFANNVATRDDINVDQQDECQENTFSIHRNRVDIEQIDKSIVPDNIIHCLWIDSNSIRLAKKKLYNEQTIELQNIENQQELQVRFILGDIDENAWSRNVYMNFRKYTLSKLYSQVFNIYLEVVDNLQLALKDNPADLDKIIDEYRKLVELCNESFKSIQDEFGAQLHRFRNFDDDILIAPYL